MDLSAWKKNSSNEQTYTGVVQSLRKVENNDSLAKKWINSVIKGVPFPVGKERYVFVIKDSASNKGYRAIVYGHEIGERLREGEVCYLSGDTDKNGVIIGRRLYDPNSGTHLEADRVFPSIVTRVTSALAIIMIAYLVYVLSHVRITTFSLFGSRTGGIISVVVMLIIALICFKSRHRILKMAGWVFLALAVYALYPPIVISECSINKVPLLKGKCRKI